MLIRHRTPWERHRSFHPCLRPLWRLRWRSARSGRASPEPSLEVAKRSRSHTASARGSRPVHPSACPTRGHRGNLRKCTRGAHHARKARRMGRGSVRCGGSTHHCCSWAICSGASALLSSWTALAALPGPVVQNTSSSRTRSCAASTCCCSSVTNCLCRSRACLADSALRASLELLESPAPGALCDSPKSLPSGPMSIVSIPSSSPTSEAPAEPATSAMARCR
mmetsp:Transcript_18900/g.42239  ORF Transcript_18900/g.42239 Transcript_18900/m.42239 type:complete len:223 (-) Transcript_18900:122-790(-)